MNKRALIARSIATMHAEECYVLVAWTPDEDEQPKVFTKGVDMASEEHRVGVAATLHALSKDIIYDRMTVEEEGSDEDEIGD